MAAKTNALTPGSLPVWRSGKPDAVLAAAVDVARDAVLSIADDAHIGAHLGVKTEGERVATHVFSCNRPGYKGWLWFAVLARVSRSKHVTVDEVGLVPSADSVVAPPWVPWAARVRPDDAREQDPSYAANGGVEASVADAALAEAAVAEPAVAQSATDDSSALEAPVDDADTGAADTGPADTLEPEPTDVQ
ncbi:MAG: DUF3027 domain-containing protein [Acidobacteria bacterium]|nr:DUF3027 domain-containing protein [Acidobacteriota bacterium]